MEGASLEGLNTELRIEHRLTKVEQALISNTRAIVALDETVSRQNGRVGKLERFQAQVILIGVVLVGAGPFVFFALDRMVPK